MGVKSLWKLLAPVGRPVMLETMEGQIMAIDSSIWIYQFQATMRDNDGRALSNAHVLGFLRRIAKLLFYGIKPVFVFDGGAPALKRNTLNERRKKKTGAATSHARLAEKLLAAQMRREAVNQAKGGQYWPVVLDDDTVYLEDIDSSMPKASPRKELSFHDHDPYRLPDIDLDATVAKATRAAVPDPRLATEEELRDFIDDMRPEDFDVTSPAFRELPTEVQYEIVGDLRLKSRQTSYARLQNMLRSAPTPLDFSKQQILNLKQRNTLTQQLLSTTDSIGKAHLTIPVRVASEQRGPRGGWILGIRDNGTRDKPIEIDQDEKVDIPEDDSDEDMEEVPIPSAGVPDADLQDYQRSVNLAALALRHSLKKPAPARKDTVSRPLPLFDLDDRDPLLEDDDRQLAQAIQDSILDGNGAVPVIDDDDEELALAIQEFYDQAKVPNVARARQPVQANAVASSSKLVDPTPRRPSESVFHYDEEAFVPKTRLETVLSIANAGLVRTPTKSAAKPASSMFGEPVLLQAKTASPAPPRAPHSPLSRPTVELQPKLHSEPRVKEAVSTGVGTSVFGQPVLLQPQTPQPSTPSPPSTSQIPLESSHASDDDMEEVLPTFEPPTPSTVSPSVVASSAQAELTVVDEITSEERVAVVAPVTPPRFRSPVASVVEAALDNDLADPLDFSEQSTPFSDAQTLVGVSVEPFPLHKFSPPTPLPSSPRNDVDIEDDEPVSGWSRSPSPIAGVEEPQPRVSSPIPENWDAAQEMDPDAEEGEFARFMSQVKGKDLDEVQQEIDDEIKVLNQQKKAAMRDSEDINQQMISQIMMMLSLFGIPYITAPMEAEAQCAELVHLGLQRVFKNMFNQSKTVECFLLSDLSRELGLDRDTLIRLAFLLGSDYVDGLPGVGPSFRGGGLHKFKDWWVKVQSGKDKPEDNKSKFRKRFKKNFKELYLPPEWPNPTVRDAYYHPTVDSSEEPFKWGLPDLDALREFLYAELSWSPGKVDELLLPIIQKIRKRGQSGALNKQGDLNGFFDISGSGIVAPRKRQAYASKRLQQVVSDYRKKRKHGSKSPAASPKWKFSQEKAKAGKSKTSAAPKRGTARGRGRGAKNGNSRKVVSEDEANSKAGECRARVWRNNYVRGRNPPTRGLLWTQNLWMRSRYVEMQVPFWFLHSLDLSSYIV
ncbi:hypothetical protein B0H13DRAFT_2228860 [Mycena leptocephala]|nr:hypothetical protein B0H13DRAFT_2228860 [Mycena leptocephala]